MEEGKQQKNIEDIEVVQHINYSCLAKIFCCKCIKCCKEFDFSLMTSKSRKEVFQSLIKRYLKRLKQTKGANIIMDPFFFLVGLLLGDQNEVYAELMTLINNQNEPTIFSKEDLQFYIPELCTYLVFHEELKNIELQKLMIRACKVDIHFSLKYFFYMRSLQTTSFENQLRSYPRVTKYNCQFRSMINNYYHQNKNQREFSSMINFKTQIKDRLEPKELSLVLDQKKTLSDGEQNLEVQNFSSLVQSSLGFSQETLSQQHQAKKDQTQTVDKMRQNKIRFLRQTNIYQCCISKNIQTNNGLFDSTVNFFSDLVALSTLLIPSAIRKEDLQKQLERINKQLPATIYIPFTREDYQDLNIINIICEDCRPFSTKERVPFYVCFESFYNPTYNQGISKDKKIRSTVNKQVYKPYLEDNEHPDELRQSKIIIKIDKDPLDSGPKQKRKISKGKKVKKNSWGNLFSLEAIKKNIMQLKKEQNQQKQEEQEQQSQVDTEQQSQKSEQVVRKFVGQKKLNELQLFGESSADQYQRISQRSPYSNLPGYKLIHVIIKSNDDLRQQSFAMQLLHEFNKIFQTQNLPVKLTPYEVLPLSYESGIIQCVKDCITIDQLKKKGGSLAELLDTKQKKKNFVYSLVGYSLITYLLQVKDRHNGNIMIKKDGNIVHIDYGFFMTNTPGKGVELQKNLPFKLTTEYVQALGGLKSKHFQNFRLLFYRAFNACRKHQHRILILTKLMYSSFGKTMPCFIKGDESIVNLERRFNPNGALTDADISVFCQDLINSSLDNWRSRWYDKWQYYFQGILY